jgi:low affinity Fe/Cu permease/uncharacterized membrane protein YbaN (DUF454 family)
MPTGLRRLALLVGGLLCVALAYLGAILPGLPTTPWVLLASYCFAQSSPRLERWLKRSPFFGRLLHDWEEHRGIRRPVKVQAAFLVVTVVSLSIVFGGLPVWLKWTIGSLAAVGICVIVFVVPTIPGVGCRESGRRERRAAEGGNEMPGAEAGVCDPGRRPTAQHAQGERITLDRRHSIRTESRQRLKSTIQDKGETMARKGGWLERMSNMVTMWTGSSGAFALALAVILAWGLTGPIFGFTDTWQLVINTGTTIITFLMVFLIQRTQNKDSLAIHLKLNELVAAMRGASNRLINVEDLTEDEVKILHQHYAKLVELAKKDVQLTRSHSIEDAELDHARKLAGMLSEDTEA